jgi:hypothetical protein
MLASGLRPGKEDGTGVSFILLLSSKCTIILVEWVFRTKIKYCLDMEIDCIKTDLSTTFVIKIWLEEMLFPCLHCNH